MHVAVSAGSDRLCLGEPDDKCQQHDNNECAADLISEPQHLVQIAICHHPQSSDRAHCRESEGV